MNNNNNDKDGPWNVPLREYVKTLPIVVTIFNLNNDGVEKEYFLDYGNKDDRMFIGKISFWCFQNGRSIECMSKKDYEKQK